MSVLDMLLASKETRSQGISHKSQGIRGEALRAVDRDRRRRVTVHVTPRERRRVRKESVIVRELRGRILSLEVQLAKVEEQRDHLLESLKAT